MRTDQKETREILTLAGKIPLTRYKLRPADPLSKERLRSLEDIRSVAPVDQYLGIDRLPFKMTGSVMLECAYWAQNQVSFDRAEENLMRTRGLFVNDDTIRLATNYIGQAVYDADCRRAREIWEHFETRPFAARRKRKGTLFLEIDGATINTRIKDKDGSSWRENKLAIFFSSDNIHTARDKNGDCRRTILKREYISLIGPVGEFKKHVLRGAIDNGYPEYERLVIITDGAEWIAGMVDELFGVDGESVIHILDFYHLCENVYSYAKAKFKMDETKFRPWAEKVCDLLKSGKGADVLQMVSETETYENTVNLHHYITMHLEHINYPEYLAAGLFVGSGAIESSNKKIVQARLKQAGMRWNVQSAQNMVSLIAKYESGLWERDVVRPICQQLGC